MSSLIKGWKSKTSTGNPTNASKDPPPPLTPLEKLLQDAPPLKDDGRDRFFGLENFGSTCYGSSILQCLFYSIPFREQVINFPTRNVLENVLRGPDGQPRLVPTVPFPQTPEQLAKAKTQVATVPSPGTATRTGIVKPEDKESQEYKKKQLLSKGQLWALRYDNSSSYGMKESLFTCMKDLFEAISMNQQRMGIIAPYKFYEIMRSSIHETWGGSQHQDAHEFLNLLLNSVVDTVEATAKTIENVQKTEGVATENGSISTAVNALDNQTGLSKNSNNAKWVHEIFEGTLTSETKCLTCENTSQRDEPFLDLSVDLDAHSSVTACLKRFSAEEMLRERDKFFCDNCGGLQEAEKRMKIKRLPKILALHLKRFRYTEDMQRMYKLFHRVTYPEQLRLPNLTADAEDPDRVYELYAVVVHIGAGPYHGHYVSIIKTPERGWLLFDDELVEPVDKAFVMNFFGDKANLACAYVLFYQETTEEAVAAEQEAEAQALKAKLAKEAPVVEENHGFSSLGLRLKTNNFLSAQAVAPTSPIAEEPASAMPALDHAITAPNLASAQPNNPLVPVQTAIPPQSPSMQAKSKKDLAKEEKERKLAEKEAAKAEKTAAKEAKAQRKEEEAKLKQVIKSSPTDSKTTNGRNIFSTLNTQMSGVSETKPVLTASNGTANSTPPESYMDTKSSFELPTKDVMNGTTQPRQIPIASSGPPTSGVIPSGSPTPQSSPNTGMLSRFRQSSKSLKHRPKFWGGSVNNPPLPSGITGNGHVPGNSISTIQAASSHVLNQNQAHTHSPSKADEFALDDSEEGSIENQARGSGENAPVTIGGASPTSAIPRSVPLDESSSPMKRKSRFSLRRKGSNMMSFSAGSDNK